MPRDTSSRVTRLVDRIADDLKRKRAWALENREPPLGMAETDAGGFRSWYRQATPEQRKQVITRENAPRVLKALGGGQR